MVYGLLVATFTQPRRWPKRAEFYRHESLAKAERILEMAREAKQAIMEDQDSLKAVSLLADIMLMAKEIEEMMREVKRGRE